MGYEMNRFGQAKLIGLDHESEPDVRTYERQVAEGLRPDTAIGRFKYLLRANYAYNYINWLRKASNDPGFIARIAGIERRVKHPLHGVLPKTARAAEYLDSDFHLEKNLLPRPLLDAFRTDLESEPAFYDPYVRDFRYEGRPEDADHPFLYMDPQRLFENEKFLEICANPHLISFCREVLGPSAALSWAWAWISRPTEAPYQNQNWHRDSSEPLNFIKVFIPLNDVDSVDDGPTEIVLGTSGFRELFAVRRYKDSDIRKLKRKQEKEAKVVLCKAGDVYFANTFALHRGTPPQRQRAILTLLVSLSPSHRTPAIGRVSLNDLPPQLAASIKANRRFFRYLVR